MAARRKRLASVAYREDLRAVANGEDSGPHPIPTDEQIGAVLGDLDDTAAPRRVIGSIEMCPGCRQPIGWDGLAWSHGTVTDCTADLTAFDPQQDSEATA